MIKEIIENINEAKKVTVGAVKKVIEKSGLQILDPQFFRVEKKNNDAGMGGYDYIAVYFNSEPRAKDKGDIKIAFDALKKTFPSTKKEGNLFIIE